MRMIQTLRFHEKQLQGGPQREDCLLFEGSQQQLAFFIGEDKCIFPRVSLLKGMCGSVQTR